MGFGTSAAHIILFIAAVIVASSVAVTLSATTGKIAIGIEERGAVITKHLSGDIEIINDPLKIPVTSGNYIFYVKNTGERNLIFTKNSVSVLIDGVMIGSTNITLSSLTPGVLKISETGEIWINVSLSSGDHRIKVVVDGISDTMDFRV